MSMIGNFMRVSPRTLAAVLAEPDTIVDLFRHGRDYFDTASNPSGTVLCVEKCWHGLHYLLTRTAWGGEPPLDFIVAGENVGDVDVGYGPARAHDAVTVARIHAALAPITTAVLLARFDPADMSAKQIYPSIWDRDDSADELLQSYVELKTFIAATAAASDAVLVWID